jgi:hypothetical protein
MASYTTKDDWEKLKAAHGKAFGVTRSIKDENGSSFWYIGYITGAAMQAVEKAETQLYDTGARQQDEYDSDDAWNSGCYRSDIPWAFGDMPREVGEFPTKIHVYNPETDDFSKTIDAIWITWHEFSENCVGQPYIIPEKRKLYGLICLPEDKASIAHCHEERKRHLRIQKICINRWKTYCIDKRWLNPEGLKEALLSPHWIESDHHFDKYCKDEKAKILGTYVAPKLTAAQMVFDDY